MTARKTRWTAARMTIGIAAAMLAVHTAHAARENLARGKTVVFAPAPNYRLTSTGDTDTTDLTDGRFSERENKQMWFESHCVGYSYPGLANLALDLGSTAAIDEVMIRFQGGSPQPGICTPGWIEVHVSDDGVQYRKVASYSRWTPGDETRFEVPPNQGKPWIHPFRFTELNVRARFVGLSFYGTGVTVTDELEILGDTERTAPLRGEPSAFSVSAPQMYVHKPMLTLSRTLSTPTPVGLILPPDWTKRQAVLELNLPAVVSLDAGSLGGVKVEEAEVQDSGQAGSGRKAHRFTVELEAGRKNWGRLLLHGADDAPARGSLRFRWILDDKPGPFHEVAFSMITMPRAPQPERILTGLGWWSLGATQGWPEALTVFEHLGFNTVPVFGRWLSREDPDSDLDFLRQARERGLRILTIDSPFHHMLASHKNNPELYAQFEDGTHGKSFCPSYRGPLYDQEIQRLARQTAQVGASYLTCDIELWSWRGPLDIEKCTRCQADFAESGADDWAEWKLRQGEEMWRDLSQAVRQAVREAHAENPDLPGSIDIGGYDFRPGHAYQFTWPFDRLYPDHMDSAQVSTYTPLHPYHLQIIGDRVREDRRQLRGSDVIPWLTPGDAGTFPGRAFYHALLECYANGARGTYFWSGRVWDTETLAAYARAVNAMSPAEKVILNGAPITQVAVTPPMRLSGMRADNDLFLLPANYRGKEDVEVTIAVPPAAHVRTVVNTDTGETLTEIQPREAVFTTSVPAGQAIPLLVTRR